MNWKKPLAWIGGAIALVILLVGIGAFLVQRNTFLHRYLLAEMVQAAQKSAGAEIAVADYSVRWLPLQLTLRGVVVRGHEDAVSPPLATLPQVEIGVSWRPLLHKEIDITHIVLESPSVYLAIDESGKSNLPTRPAPGRSSSSNLQISIEHAVVQGGDLRYADRLRKIDVDLPDLHLDINQRAADQYSGNLGYGRGEITAHRHPPVFQSAEIKFLATHSGINFDRIHLSTDASQLNAAANMQGYSNPSVQADYRLTLSAAELHAQLPLAPISAGDIELAGSLRYQSAGALLQALSTAGRLSSPDLTVSLSNSKLSGKRPANSELNLRSLSGSYSLQGGNLQVRAVRAEVMGGMISAEFTAERLTGVPAYQVSLSADKLSLEQVERVAPMGVVPLRGAAQLQASARWTSTIRNAIAHADAAISASIDSAQSASNSAGQLIPQSLPLEADLHVTYDAPHSTLTITDSSVASNGTTIAAAGTISAHSALSVHARSTDLRETHLLISSMRALLSATPQTSSSGSTPLDLRGAASIDAQVEGQIQNPRVTGHLQADALQIRQASWPHAQADFDITASSLNLQNGLAETANHGRLNFALATSLQHWSYNPENAITAQLQASQIPASDLEQLAGVSMPVAGTFYANVSIQGPLANPMGQASVELRDALLWGEPVRSVVTQLRAANKTISAQFVIAAPAGTISGEGQFDLPGKNYDISIDHSVIKLGQVHYFSSRGSIEGTLGIEAHGQGTWKAPQIDVRLDGSQLAFRNTPLGSMTAQLHVADKQATFALTSNIEGGQVRADGNAALVSPYIVHGNFELRSPEFGPLLATYMKSAPADLRGTADVSARIDGPLAHPQEVKANVELSTLDLAYKGLAVATAGPVRLNYADAVLTISQAELKGTGTNFKIGGTLPLGGSAPLNITSNGSLDLHLLNVLGANTQASGKIQVDVTARGALKQPQISGTIEMIDAAFVSDVAPVGVNSINARIALNNNRLNIENLSGQMGGGTFAVSGFATYAPVSFSLQVDGKSVRIRYPQGTRAQLDAGLTFTGTSANSVLNGRVTIDQLSFTPDFDLANFIGQFNSAGASTPSPWQQNTHLNVALASSDVLALSSSKLSLQGSVDLRVAGTVANPVVLGRTILTGGSLIFMSNVYQVQNGTVVFSNPIRTEPALNLYVTTTVQNYDITLNFVGPLDRMRTNYTSNPVLPSVDIIHLLAFGTTTAQAAATATPASVGAESVIANRLASQVSNRLEKLTGISQLQIDPSLGGNNSDPGARVAIQERIASNILFTFATDLTNTQNEVVQVKYQTRGRLSFTLTRDEYGSYALEVKTRKTF